VGVSRTQFTFFSSIKYKEGLSVHPHMQFSWMLKAKSLAYRFLVLFGAIVFSKYPHP
jgi:hypothetical protein